MKYYPMHMHLHTIHQPGASMESHIYNAGLLGMKYIRFTDHDTRTGENDKTVKTFDFTRKELQYENDAGIKRGWKPIGECEPIADGKTVTFSGSGVFGVEFFSDGQRHSRALPAEVSLTLGMKHTISQGSRVILDILLSQRPPEHKEGHFLYVIGEPITEPRPYTASMNIDASPDGIYRLNISRDLERYPAVGGLDNVFGTISVIIEGEGSVSLSLLEISSVYGYNDLIVRQRAIAEKIGERYGIKPFVTTEISSAGQHKNCFSSNVPVLDYTKGKITGDEAVAHILSHGGIFSYNHPFECPKYKRKEFTREEIDGIVAFESAALIENKVFGAALIEVGFPLGRGLFTLEDYIKLWDNLSAAGVFITGEGDSDCHKSHSRWFSGNNFASWIGVDDGLTHPISEEVFGAAMVAGHLYMGDPVYLRGRVEFSCLGAEMGSVIVSDGGEYPISLLIEDLPEGATVKLVRCGETVLEEQPTGDSYNRVYPITPSGSVDFIRAEMYNAEGRCVMLTNPIYFVEPGSAIAIPKERLAKVKK